MGGYQRYGRRPGNHPVGRWARRLAIATAAVMILSFVVPQRKDPGPDPFPLDWLWSALRTARAAAAPLVTGLPVQPWGAKRGPETASYADTRAGRGNGLPPGRGIGAVEAYEPPTRQRGRAAVTPGLGDDASFSPAKSRRVAEAASATSDLYANPDGSYTRKVHQLPVNFRDTDGRWTPIDPNLSRGADGRYRQRANSVGLDFAPRADDANLTTVRVDSGHSVSYALAGAAKVTPVVAGDTVTYADALAGVDLRFESRATEVKESIVLRSAAAPTSYVFPMRLRGLTPKLAADGSVTLHDRRGTVRATIPAGYMEDSRFDPQTGAFTRSYGVRYELVDAGGPALKVTIDGAWLRDPARVFPVTVDPTTTFGATGDTYAYSTQPGNHGSENELLAGTWNGTAKAHSFLHFNNFALAYGGSKLSSVSLKIFNSWAGTCTAKPFTVHPITQSWTESGVTSYPGPSFGASIGSVTANPGPACTNTGGDRSIGTWMTVPLAVDTFQNWALGGTNNGLAVSASQTDITQWKRFTSRNGPAGLGPYLQVTYTAGVRPQVDAQYPPHGHAVSSLTPELLVAAHDPDSYPPNPLTYNFAVYDRAGNKIKESGPITSRSWVVPTGTLAWGQTYHWTVLASDGFLTSSSQTINTLTTPVPQPLITSGLGQNGGQGFEPSVANYTTSATDATIATVGPALSVVRSYNSQDPRVGLAFGAGWSSLVDTRATEQRDATGALQTVVVTYPGGQDVAFGRNTDGSFAPPLGRFATFTAVTGGYRLVDKDGTTYTFTAATGVAGRYGVTSIADAQGRTETFVYDTANRLATIRSAAGRALHLTWSTPAGATTAHVATVTTDPATPGAPDTAATWRYGYTGDQLTKVCPPTSTTACTTYTYGTGSLYPTTLMNAAPKSYWRLDERSGTTATSEMLDNQGTDASTYTDVALGQPGPLPGSTARAAGFNGTSSLVRLPAQLSGAATNLAVSMWFKADAGDQGPLFSYQADPVTGGATTAGNYTPALYLGTSGRLRGQFWDNSINPIATGGSVTDGQWHHVVLTAAGNKQWLYLDGTLVGTKTGAIQTINAYSTANMYLGAGFLGGAWPDQPHYTGGTDNTGHAAYLRGTVSDAALFDRSLTADEVATIHGTATKVARPLTSVVRPSGNPSATIAYDSATGAVTQVTDANGGVWKLNRPTVSGSSQVYAGTVLSGGPADYWRFGETGTTDAINEVNGSTATYNGVTLGSTGGPFGDATVATFDGTSSYLRLADGYVPTSGPHSISLWFRTTSGNRTLFSYQADPITNASTPQGYTPALYIGASGKLHGQFYRSGSGMFSSAASVADGQWHHVVLAAGTTSQSLYLDGELVDTKTSTVGHTGQNRVYVGAGFLGGVWPDQTLNNTGTNTGYPTYFQGDIAEVAFYRTQLTEAQAAAQFGARGETAGVPAKTVTVTDPGGRMLTNVYDVATGRQVAETDALGNQTKYGYDVRGFLRTVTDPNGNVTTTEHDVRGNIVSNTTCQDQAASRCSTVYFTYHPDATSTTLTPDPRNDVLLTVRDGRSASATDDTYLTRYAYDAMGNRISTTDPLSRVTRTAYTDGTSVPALDGGYAPAGLPMTVTTPGGAVQSVVYYASGDVAKVTDPAGKVTTYRYDGLGRVVTETETTDTFPAGLVTSYEYDLLGRPVKRTDPATTNRVTGAVHTPVTTTAYDVDGLVVSQTIADLTGGDASRTEKTTYNAYGQQVSTTDATGKTTRFEYDAYGNPVKELDADGGEIRSTYDPAGNLLTSTLVGYVGDPNDPSPATDLTVESRSYDPAGRLAAQTDAMGWVTAFTYTDNGLTAKVVRKDPTTGASFVVQEDSYDGAGNLVTRKTQNGTTTVTYAVDAAGRPASSTLDPTGLKRTVSYDYSRDDNLVAEILSDPTGVLARSETMYDPMGRVVAETTHNSLTTPVGRWRFDQTTGATAKDSVGNNPAAATDVTWSTERGGAATFNGTSSYLATDSPAVDSARSFTVAAWVKLTDNTARRKVLATVGKQQSSFELRYDNSNNRWRFVMKYADVPDAGGTAANSTSVPALNTWTHLAGVYDASTGGLSLYVNGVKEGSSAHVTPFTTLGPLLIGAGIYNAERGDHWKGGISDVQAYSRVLTAAEIGKVYAGTAPTADAGVVRTSYRLDADGLARAMTDPNGNVTNYDYDEAGRPTVTVGPAVQSEPNGSAALVRPISYTGYDTFGAEVESRDPNGNVVVTEYDAEGREVATRMPSYTPPGSTTPITPVTTNSYDALGQLTSSTDALGRITRYGYDQFGRVARVTDPNQGVTTYTYDPLGDQLSMTDPTGAKSTATYDYLANQITTTDVVRQTGAAYTTRYTYGTNGLLASVKTPAGATTTLAYNAAGETVTVTDAANNQTRYTYNGAGEQTRVTLADGTYTTTDYDMAGREIAERSYDATGRLLSSESDRYDAAGNIVASTDARGTTTTFTYDPTGLVTSEVQPISGSDSITTTFGYDAAGNRTRFTDGRGHSYLTTYNTWNLPESQTEPATSAYRNLADRSFTLAYDAAGDPTRAFLPGGVTIDYAYDEVGNLIRQSGAGAEVATGERRFGYDIGGRVVSATTPAGTNTFTYDDRDMLLSADGPSGSSSFTYTPDGLLASRTDAAGTTSYDYDPAGRLALVDNATTGVRATYAYDNLSQVRTITYGSGGNRTFGYDAQHRLVSDEVRSAAGTTVGKITYGYDANGNETSKTTTGFAGSASNTYTYDLADRLTSWSTGSTTTVYAYDKSGNRVQVGDRLFSYDERNQLVSDNRGTTYRYTARGTLAATTGGGETLPTATDAFGQIRSQGVGGSGAQTYDYDALGRVLRSGFSYSGAGNDLAGDGTAVYTRDPEADLVGATSGGTKRIAWTDQHDDVVGQLDPTAATMAGSTTYDPLGRVLASNGMIGNLGYQSEWTDRLTGRVNMLTRWYNTDTGQFDTRDAAEVDPVPDSVAANRFAYADDNPMTVTDPDGQWGIKSLVKKVKKAAKRVVKTVKKTAKKVAKTVKKVVKKVKKAAKKVVHTVRKAASKVKKAVSRAYHKVKKAVVKKYKQVRKWVSHKVAKVKQKVKRIYNKVKQAGKAVVAKASRAIKKTVNKVKDAYHASAKWVKDHKNAILEVAAIGAGIVAGLACTAATAGVGAVACMVGAAAVINVAKDAAQGDIDDLGDVLGSAGTGALQGLMGGVGGAIGGRLAAGVTSKLGGFASSFVGRSAGGALSGGVGDAVSQFMLTGHVDASGVVVSAGIGAVFGGFAKGGASRRGPPDPDGTPRNSGSGCTHSFDPDTRVLMADGSTRPIRDVNVGDRVKATDPTTGVTTARKVEALHLNRDRDLTDVTVTGNGRTTTLHTTQHHPFWDQSVRQWRNAADLKANSSILVDPAGRTQRVTKVRNFVGDRYLRDLTVANDHTYYVLAASAPVLVHNCPAGGGGSGSGSGSGGGRGDGGGGRADDDNPYSNWDGIYGGPDLNRRPGGVDEGEAGERLRRRQAQDRTTEESEARAKTAQTTASVAKDVGKVVNQGSHANDPISSIAVTAVFVGTAIRRGWKNWRGRRSGGG
ncbi:hypothetical protein GCM10027290_19980 [Micromonospora sonneratiae]|uniref:LamG-like jellyroll fold domain-containing protein n=1 Tax=Micromonospora sonneratiae TaxID=1184706 RepID=A0ABW3YIK5_9ACTN